MASMLKFLMCYAQEGDEFLDSIVIGDETWGFHHTPESKQQSLQWCHTQSPRHSHLAGLWIGAAIKVDGRVATVSIKNFPIGLHVMYLYFPDTPHN